MGDRVTFRGSPYILARPKSHRQTRPRATSMFDVLMSRWRTCAIFAEIFAEMYSEMYAEMYAEIFAEIFAELTQCSWQ